MIVRINQLDLRRADGLAGWEPNESDPRAPIHYDWPEGTQAVQVLVLDVDERQQMMGLDFRRRQVRKLIGDVCVALAGAGQPLVARFDGPVSDAELVPVLRLLTDPSVKRYSVSGFHRIEEAWPNPVTSVRVGLTIETLRPLVNDRKLGLDRETRLRIFVVPAVLVGPLLDVTDVEDERWPEILAQVDFVLSTTRGGESLTVHSRKFTPADIKAKLTRELLGESPAGV